MEAKIQFIKGLDEKVLPDVRLTRSRDGSTGTATFRFKNPNILDKSTAKEGEITAEFHYRNGVIKKVEQRKTGYLNSFHI